jgi:hypothetical protein
MTRSFRIRCATVIAAVTSIAIVAVELVSAHGGSTASADVQSQPAPVAVHVPAGLAPASQQAPQAAAPSALAQPGMPGPAPLPATPSGIRTAIAQPGNICIQIPPAITPLQQGMTADVYLKCKAALGTSICVGTLTLTIRAHSNTEVFRIATRRGAEITIKLPQRARAAAQSHRTPALHATLEISTRQPDGPAKVTTGTLTIQITKTG